jgi:hypothetical protein
MHLWCHCIGTSFSAPIFTYKNILDKAGIYLKPTIKIAIKTLKKLMIFSNPETFGNEDNSKSDRIYMKHSLQELTDTWTSSFKRRRKTAQIREDFEEIIIKWHSLIILTTNLQDETIFRFSAARNGKRLSRKSNRNRNKKCFGYQMRFDLNEGFPMVTTKATLKIYYTLLCGS